jgi:DNA-binding MarR family transcriptional regulator
MSEAEYDPPARLRRLPSWLTAQAARRSQRLAEQGPASQADLGRRLWIDRSDLHTILNELEDTGQVARERDQTDRRRNVVVLTRAGRAALTRLDKRVDAAQDALLAPLSASERRELRRLLERVARAD